MDEATRLPLLLVEVIHGVDRRLPVHHGVLCWRQSVMILVLGSHELEKVVVCAAEGGR